MLPRKTIDVNLAAKLYETMTLLEVGKQLGVNDSTLRRHLIEAGFAIRPRGYLPDGVHHRNLRLNTDDLTEMYKTASCNQVAKELGVSEASVRDRLHNTGVVLRGRTERADGSILRPRTFHRKHFFNEQFFETIDTEEKAYFLGLLVSDGCVLNNTVSLNQVIPNSDVVTKLCSAIGYDGALHQVAGKPVEILGKQCNSRPQVVLRLHSKKLVESLARYGVVPRKSHITFYPELPDFAHRHFIRGLWDGDGGVYKSSAVLTGTQQLLESVRDIALDFCGSPPLNDPIIIRNGDHWRINVQKSRKHMLQWIYNDATVYMSRKYSAFLMYWL